MPNFRSVCLSLQLWMRDTQTHGNTHTDDAKTMTQSADAGCNNRAPKDIIWILNPSLFEIWIPEKALKIESHKSLTRGDPSIEIWILNPVPVWNLNPESRTPSARALIMICVIVFSSETFTSWQKFCEPLLREPRMDDMWVILGYYQLGSVLKY